jgi:hypothetical protein
MTSNDKSEYYIKKFITLLDLIHTNKEYPENHNIYIKNDRLKQYYVVKPTGIGFISSNDLAKQLLKKNIERIENRYKSYIEMIKMLSTDIVNLKDYIKDNTPEYLNYLKSNEIELIKHINIWLITIKDKIEKPLWVPS